MSPHAAAQTRLQLRGEAPTPANAGHWPLPHAGPKQQDLPYVRVATVLMVGEHRDLQQAAIGGSEREKRSASWQHHQQQQQHEQHQLCCVTGNRMQQ